jgi:hypothetical protein
MKLKQFIIFALILVITNISALAQQEDTPKKDKTPRVKVEKQKNDDERNDNRNNDNRNDDRRDGKKDKKP